MIQNIAIIGGGVGGLSVAICLALIGKKPSIYEKDSHPAASNTGLQLGANATRILRAIGVLNMLMPKAVCPKAIALVTAQTARPIAQMRLGLNAEKRWDAPYITVARRDLMAALRARLDALAPGALKSGCACHINVDTPKNGVLVLNDGQNIAADMVIAADGIGSSARQILHETGDNLAFSGFGAWRGVLDDANHENGHKNNCAHGGTVHIYVGADRHFVQTRIDGGARINFVAIAPMRLASHDLKKADKAAAIADFKGFVPGCTRMIEQAQTLLSYPLFVHEPLQYWSKGKVALLGDAAHPMMPSLAQGAAMALEDAYILAQEIQKAPHYKSAFASYYAKRFVRTRRVQSASLANMKLFHHFGALPEYGARALINMTTQFLPALTEKRYDWLYGYDCGAL